MYIYDQITMAASWLLMMLVMVSHRSVNGQPPQRSDVQKLLDGQEQIRDSVQSSQQVLKRLGESSVICSILEHSSVESFV